MSDKGRCKPGCNNIAFYDTSCITLHILWYQLIPHCYISRLNNTQYITTQNIQSIAFVVTEFNCISYSVLMTALFRGITQNMTEHRNNMKKESTQIWIYEICSYNKQRDSVTVLWCPFLKIQHADQQCYKEITTKSCKTYCAYVAISYASI